jgi:cysteine desulfurase/selenocysteine lyase
VTTGAYLDYAGIGPVRPRAIAAMRAVLDEVLPHGAAEIHRMFDSWTAARETAARLLECAPEEIAMVPNTSSGLHLVADGMEWRAGDEVVVFDRDFPANVHPWRRLAGRGVRLRWVPMRAGGYELDDVAAAIGPATRLVAASHVNFRTGFRLDLDALCALAGRHGALVCVDAVQSLGTRPLSLSRVGIDFLVAGGHKWLCSPPGTGLFFCRRERLAELPWGPSGWFGYEGAQDMLVKGAGHFTYDLPPRPAARRFEGGMPNLLGLVGFAVALAELEEIGLDVIARRIAELTGRLRAGLASLGYLVESPAGPKAESGIVSFAHPTRGSQDLVEALARAGCHVSHPDGLVRAAPHFWTTDAELANLLGRLGELAHRGGRMAD